MVSNDVQDLPQAWDIQGEAIEVSQKLNYEGESDFKSTAGYHGPCPTAGRDCSIVFGSLYIQKHQLHHGALPYEINCWCFCMCRLPNTILQRQNNR